MKTSDLAKTHIVLVGGGHSHVTVIRSLAMDPEPGVVVTLIAKELDAPYSGMLPGLVAGHYDFDACHIDLVKLAGWAGFRLVHGIVSGIDRVNRRVLIEGRAPLGYDLVSIDVGITPKLDGLPGAAEHALGVKPVSSFYQRWRDLEERALTPDGPRRIALIGAGAAGFEVILAARYRLRSLAVKRGINPDEFSFRLFGGGGLLPSQNSHARRIARRCLAERNVELVENDRVTAVAADHVQLASGRTFPADAVLISTDAQPAGWFREAGLPLDERGFLAVRPTLQLLDDDDVFAVGDCATVLEHRREKAGVFAVRQGPPLTENLRLRARGLAARPFRPQKQFLTLISAGDKYAIASRNGFAIGGKPIWTWKDRIDREFMDMFDVGAAMGPGGPDIADDMRCGGCAAKVGPVSLSRSLRRLGADPASLDDVAVIDEGGETLRLETVDFFRAFWPEPYVFGRIAAIHAMNDILAKGGSPTHALANVVLPHASPSRVEEDLFQVLAGAKSAFEEAGVPIVGGHSGEGSDLAAGFFVSGRVDRSKLVQKRGLRRGDALILTRPIGTGILFAGAMRNLVRGRDVAFALKEMANSSHGIARAAVNFVPSAGTDITGFGICGHLLEMIGADDIGIEIDLTALPLYPAVAELARAGVVSTLLGENLRVAAGDDIAPLDPATRAILFDPQTAGGFLFGVEEGRAEAMVAAIQQAGAASASVIGRVTARAEGGQRLSFKGRIP